MTHWTRTFKKKGRPLDRPSEFVFEFKSNLQPLAENVIQQITNAIAVTPFVIIPADELEEAAVQFDTGTGIEDG